MAKRRQVLLFLVEGITDRTTFELAMSKLINQEEVQFVLTNGDITSDYKVATNNVVAHVGNIIKKTAERYKFVRRNFYKVVHIIDTDAAFISEKNILDIHNNEKFCLDNKMICYDPDNGIWTQNRQSIIARNVHKRAKVKLLQRTKSIWGGIPYEMYYMSMNLEHVLYNLPNATNEQKNRLANQTETEWFEHPQKLIETFTSERIAVKQTDYLTSWNYIEGPEHALERCSNFNLFLDNAQRDSLIVAN